MKLPYGIADFYKLRTEGYLYVDRTAHLRTIEDASPQLLFLRPRRFGKSLLLSTLENYYDLKKAGEFERLFGDLAIGQNPTPKRNQYFVLKWDFSAVEPGGAPQAVRDALHLHINKQIRDFAVNYQAHLPYPIDIEPTNAIGSFQSLLSAVKATPHRLYLLIDEYDNFANEILMSGQATSRDSYDSLLRGEGALKTVFKTVKAAAAGWGLDRVFITGVAPIVLTDLTCGYNVAESIYLWSEFQSLCGFSETEVERMLDLATAAHGLSANETEAAMMQMRAYYNGYCFSEEPAEPIYNPMLALYYLNHWQRKGEPPKNMFDRNLAMDGGKLNYIAALPGGPRVIVDALQNDERLAVHVLADRFGVEDLLTVRQDKDFMASLLYYFGVLTQDGETDYGETRLRIPNLVTRKLYAEQLQTLLLPDAAEQSAAREAARLLAQKGDPQPLRDFIEQRLFRAFDNRDYLQANELTLKTALLTLLFNDLLYIADSETAAGRRYADLTLIARADQRHLKIFDLLLECKFVKLGEAGLTGVEARALSREQLTALPPVQRKLAEACEQTADYVRELRARYPLALRLRVYAVVALGFERLVWKEIEGYEP
jgi:Predicted AAA-ATPase